VAADGEHHPVLLTGLSPTTFRLADIRTAMPGVSDQTIRLVLDQLRNEDLIRVDGTGRSATWTRLANTAASK
jgi:DNA-binding HxlR family transcriptional regulator